MSMGGQLRAMSRRLPTFARSFLIESLSEPNRYPAKDFESLHVSPFQFSTRKVIPSSRLNIPANSIVNYLQ